MNGTASYSYASAALAFLFLCVLLLSKWRDRAPSRWLAAAAALTVLWAAACAMDGWSDGWTGGAFGAGTGGEPGPASLPPLATVLAEWLRSAAWSAVLLGMLGQFRPRGVMPTPLSRWTAGAYLLALAVALSRPWLAQSDYFTLSVLGGIGLAVLGLALVEQLYRNTSAHKRWAVKFACLGMGGLFVYDFYMYSDALLFRELSGELWAARGLVNALTAPLLALAVARQAAAVPQLAVSRRMLFHSAALVGAAVYLLTMSSAAYYLRYVGGSWGSLMQLAFLFGASMLLAGILFSGTMRAWLRVFISKHFYRYNYDYREEWLRFTGTLSQPGPLLAERSIQALAALVESPGGALWLREDGGGYAPAAQWQMPPQRDADCRLAPGAPFARFIEQRRWLVDLHGVPPDGAEPAPDWLRAIPRAWLVVPLMLHGQLTGFVLLLRARSPVVLNWEVIDLLKIAGSQAASYLAQQQADSALMLARQFDSFNRLSTFVVHDLKNLVAQLSLLAANAEKHHDNLDFQADMRRTMVYSVQKMKGMLQKLSRTASPQPATPLALERLLLQAVEQKAVFRPTPRLSIAAAGADVLVLADAERLERVLGHLIQNAIEATPKDGEVGVTLSRDGERVKLEIRDTGSGMSEEFVRERLFKPFDSTKSAGMGIGAFESREYIHELGGQLEVSSRPQQGSTFTVHLPLYRRDALERAA
ncbi:XrtA/PEP-CTERM system histidine kinase PrsK [Rugamonas sp.]|uniref:XrtA/PEP-CTERM system histidine kinase PrsK n=1 Tax=Rugamonas sp. TaxID=1926287 RepID=UPI0025D7BB29|nr:XrtA/PEP-CTERM system histidine kinase PrsK [Rugamonas sp.]